MIFELKKKEQDLGFLGTFFGAASAASNIAGLVAVLVIIAFVIVIFVKVEGIDKSDVLKTLATLLATALAYLFGASSRDK